MTARPVRTVFLGSGVFAVPSLAALADHPSVEIVGVITASARPVGRRQELQPTPVARWAVDRGLDVLTPARLRDAESADAIGALAPELLVLADYGQIVPASLLGLPRHGALNLHPSLLPRHRGASPIPAAILAGDAQTGVTLMLMDAGLDSGPIVAQRQVELSGTEAGPELEAHLAQLAAELLRDELPGWLAGTTPARTQPDEGVTLTRPLRRSDGWLDPARPADVLERQVRAHQPWPGSFIETAQGRLLVWRARPLTSDAGADAGGPGGAPAGTLLRSPSGNPSLVTADGFLELVDVQPAGGRRMSGSELLRGRPALVGTSVASAPDAVSGG